MCTHIFRVLVILKITIDNFLSTIRMGYLLFWDDRRSLAIFADVSGQHVVPFSRVEQALEDANQYIVPKLRKQLPTYSAQHQRRTKTWSTPRRKSRSPLHLTDLCNGEEVFQLGDGMWNFKYNLAQLTLTVYNHVLFAAPESCLCTSTFRAATRLAGADRRAAPFVQTTALKKWSLRNKTGFQRDGEFLCKR